MTARSKQSLKSWPVLTPSSENVRLQSRLCNSHDTGRAAVSVKDINGVPDYHIVTG